MRVLKSIGVEHPPTKGKLLDTQSRRMIAMVKILETGDKSLESKTMSANINNMGVAMELGVITKEDMKSQVMAFLTL